MREKATPVTETPPRSVGDPAGDSTCRLVEMLVGTAFGVAPAELRRPSRGTAPAALARQTAMYLARVHLGLSLRRVCRHFGRDRTTIAYACRRVEENRERRAFDRMLIDLEAALQSWRRSLAAAGRAP